MSWFSFRRNAPINAGQTAQRSGLVMGTLPYYDALGWSQFRVLNPLMETQAPQLWVNPAAPVAGLGGLVQGGIVFQSLSANPNPNQ